MRSKIGGLVVSFVLLLTANLSIAAVFPIANLPGDSDCPRDEGEMGAIGNRQWYTVVWGGKYDGAWSDRCKGTGGHPGMDIAVPSGTQVHAIGDGVIEQSYDSPSWGGLVVIKHEKDLFGTPTDIWSIYAHLRSRLVAQGDVVSEDQIIGESGGGSTDPNPGISTASHLHFQIDKGETFVSPYWPANEETELPDPYLSENTYDPIKFIETQQLRIYITIRQPDTLHLIIFPGQYEDKLADWWFVVYTPTGEIWSYNLSSKVWVEGLRLSQQSGITGFSQFINVGGENWWNQSGVYTFVFAVDLTPDGVLAGTLDEDLFSTFVDVDVEKHPNIPAILPLLLGRGTNYIPEEETWSQDVHVLVSGRTLSLTRRIELTQNGVRVIGALTDEIQLSGCGCGPIVAIGDVVGTIANNMITATSTWRDNEICNCDDGSWISVGGSTGTILNLSLEISGDRSMLTNTTTTCALWWNGNCVAYYGSYTK